MNDVSDGNQAQDLETLLAERIADYRLCLLPLEDALLEAAERLGHADGTPRASGGVGLPGEGAE
jgi:hypothetical protein